MEQIIHAFGIDGRLIVIQLINFGILLGALLYFLYTPMLNMLKAREDKIKEGIENAEAAAVARANAETEKAQILTKAHESATEVVNRAKAGADEKAGQIVSEAEIKANELLAQAAKNAELLRDKITKEAEAEIAKTAILATEKLLKGQNT